MVWCNSCVQNVHAERTNYDSMLCCSICGKVLESFAFSDEPTFVKNSSGQSQLSGNYVRTIQSDYSLSRERILNKAHDDIKNMRDGLEMGENNEIVRIALRFYTIAVERNFTRGRSTEQVQAACLYIACREKEKPYLLIDFSNYLQINVYVLGAVFLQLCKLLSLEQHPIVQKPVDPSLFIERFTECLLKGKKKDVSRKKEISKTALQIIASMKRDWMQTGRKPSGLCGAALYISALSYGHKCSKSDIVRVVHICEATLMKRLVEFESTESGSLTIEEFIVKAHEFEEYNSTKQLNTGLNGSGINEVLCLHKECKEPYAHGLCKNCYDEFIKLSGGLEGGLNPPAFQHAERERLAIACDDENANDSSVVNTTCEKLSESEHLNFEKEVSSPNMSGNENLHSTQPESIGAATEHAACDAGDNDKSHGVEGMSSEACDADNLSDIDDAEVDSYLHNEEEKHFKKIIWEEMNREYLEEQAAKEAIAGDGGCDAKLAATKSRKERQQKRAAEARNSAPPQTAAEATRQMLTKKRLSSKINYDVLDKLFDESEAPEKSKKKRSESDNDTELPHFDKNEFEVIDANKNDELLENEYEEEGLTEEAYGNDTYYENLDEAYDYNDDDAEGF